MRKPTDAERRIQRLVALLQMTYVGAPMIYYGTEAGMWGGDDPCDRMPMVWPDLTYEPQAADPLESAARPADVVEFDEALFDFYRAAIDLRKQMPALRRGSIEFVRSRRQGPLPRLRSGPTSKTPCSSASIAATPTTAGRFRSKPANRSPRSSPHPATSASFPIATKADAAVVTVPACDGVVLELQPRGVSAEHGAPHRLRLRGRAVAHRLA